MIEGAIGIVSVREGIIVWIGDEVTGIGTECRIVEYKP
jgi:hypothetical protein